jgi:hypothetical protein
MDIIHQCLSLAPVPYLAPAFGALRFIWSSVQQAQASEGQLKALTQSIAQLLHTLDTEYHAGRLLQAKTLMPLADLRRYVVITLPLAWMSTLPCRLLDEIAAFIQKESPCSFLQLLFTKDQRIARIDTYYRRIGTSIESFQVSCDILKIVPLIPTGGNNRYQHF